MKKISGYILTFLLTFVVGICNIDAKKISEVQIGDYIKMTPTATTYKISKAMTGYTSDQTINPSELNLWRVIKKNSDGTVEVISEYLSSTSVYFRGKTGYMNLVGTLNTIAKQYESSKYTSNARNFGYESQIEKCTTFETCPADTRYETDGNLVTTNLGTLKSTKIDGTENSYWASSRFYYGAGGGLGGNYYAYFGIIVSIQGYIISDSVSNLGSLDGEEEGSNSVRPILTMKSDIELPISSIYNNKNLYDLDNPKYGEDIDNDDTNKKEDNVDPSNPDDNNMGTDNPSIDDGKVPPTQDGPIENPNTGYKFILLIMGLIVIFCLIISTFRQKRKMFKI